MTLRARPWPLEGVALADDKPKQPRIAKPGDLLSQWWTLGAIAADRRTTGRHMKAGPTPTGRSTAMAAPASHTSCKLSAWTARPSSRHAVSGPSGVTRRAPGIGTRPSEYVPQWVTSASGVQMTTESYLPEPAYKPASGKEDDDCGAATPPLSAGLAPADAETPRRIRQVPKPNRPLKLYGERMAMRRARRRLVRRGRRYHPIRTLAR